MVNTVSLVSGGDPLSEARTRTYEMCVMYVYHLCLCQNSWQLDFNILPTAEGHPRMIKLCHKQILISKLRHKQILISKLHHKQILISKLFLFIVNPFSSQSHKISLYTNIKQGIHTKIKHFFKFKNFIFQYCFC